MEHLQGKNTTVGAATETENDPRFTLTPWERDSVVRLKVACDENCVAYRSVFELAKFVLVSKSIAQDHDPKADEKRLQEALNRLTKKRSWEKANGVDKMNIEAVNRELTVIEPDYHLVRYYRDKEGHILLGYRFAHAPTRFVCSSKENTAKAIAMSVWKMDLAAATMEEARRGIAFVGICEGRVGIPEAVRYVRLLNACKGSLSGIHAHRVRRVYVQAPPFLAHMVNTARMFLPKKLRERKIVTPTISDLEQHIDLEHTNGAIKDGLDWVKERAALYGETVQRLTL